MELTITVVDFVFSFRCVYKYEHCVRVLVLDITVCCMMIAEVKIVQQMPIQSQGNKPSVAIITSKYYEKLAVDAMMENKTTFVRYKTEGSLQYTCNS